MKLFITKMVAATAFFTLSYAPGTTITQSGYHLIGADIIATPTYANDFVIRIASHNVTLDLGNHIITQMPGNLQPGLDAIVISTGYANTRIINANIQNISGIGIHAHDGCVNIGLWDSKLQGCNAGGIVFDGSVYGIAGVTIGNTHVVTSTGAGGNPAYGIRARSAAMMRITDCYVAFNDAGITTSSYGISFEKCGTFQCLKTTLVGNGGTGFVAGLAISQSSTGAIEDTIFYKNTNRDISGTGTVCGMFIDQSQDIIINRCTSSCNSNPQMAAFGFLVQNGRKNVFRDCLAELNTGGQHAAGFKFSGEYGSNIFNCYIEDQKTTVAGTAYGVLLANNCSKCQIRDNSIYNNKGVDATFGIKDERAECTSAITKNYAFNNGTNYSVTYTTGVTLPVISASTSGAPGLPSGTGGILDNIDINP